MEDERLAVVMGLIMHGGNAKSLAFQAVQFAKDGQFDQAETALKDANLEIKRAHDVQAEMLTKEARGEHAEVDLYMLHGQDHLMNAITFRDIAVEFIELLKRVDKLEKKVESPVSD